MTSWLNQTEFVHNIAHNLLQAKHTHYHEDYLKHKLIQCNSFCCSSMYVKNRFGERVKMSVLRESREGREGREGKGDGVGVGERDGDREMGSREGCRDGGMDSNSVCIIYLHGFGSHRLEGVTILSALPKEWGLCCFDFSGSGKSQGQISTYGLKEYLDIQPVIDTLKQKFGYKKFVLWGRSMGATASLLYTSSPQTRHKQSILFQVLDSPFSSFSSIAQHHATTTYKLPQLFINFGLNILKQHFKAHEYNPFKIDLLERVGACCVPALFVYCEGDTIIPARNSCEIIGKFNERVLYERLIIPENHNNFRSLDTLKKIMEIVRKYAIDCKVKEKIKYKRGIHELFSGPFTPTGTSVTVSMASKDRDHDCDGKNNEGQIKIKRLSGLNNFSKSKLHRKELIKQRIQLNPENGGHISYFFNSCSNCRKVQ